MSARGNELKVYNEQPFCLVFLVCLMAHLDSSLTYRQANPKLQKLSA